jgi:type IV pilus biogenesis protein CpaD/CtpE
MTQDNQEARPVMTGFASLHGNMSMTKQISIDAVAAIAAIALFLLAGCASDQPVTTSTTTTEETTVQPVSTTTEQTTVQH